MTIKELSAKCEISEQSLRAWCKKNNVSKAAISNEGSERKATKPSYIITPKIEAEIMAYYGQNQEKNLKKELNETKAIKEGYESNEPKEKKETNLANGDVLIKNELLKQLSIKDEQLKSKDDQIFEKDKQITALQEQNKDLIEALNNAQGNNKSLTDALVAAQTLHAATIQIAALVDKSAELERKWWQKIFRKNNT